MLAAWQADRQALAVSQAGSGRKVQGGWQASRRSLVQAVTGAQERHRHMQAGSCMPRQAVGIGKAEMQIQKGRGRHRQGGTVRMEEAVMQEQGGRRQAYSGVGRHRQSG